MADRLINNPHLEAIPDHAAPHYNALRDTLVQNGMTAEQATQAFNDAWTQNHDAQVQAWDQQVIDNAAAEEALRQQLIPPPAPNEERPEAEKKKPVIKDFDDATTVGNYIAPRPS